MDTVQNRNTQLFPYAVLRIGAEPFSVLGDLLFEVGDRMDRMQEIKKKISEEKDILNQQLFIHVQSMDDRKQQQLFQNIRRDIHNSRTPSAKDMEQVYAIAPVGIVSAFRRYFKLFAEEGALIDRFNSDYTRFTTDSKNVLFRLASSNVLQRGLVLSSEIFFRELRRNLDSPRKMSPKEYGRFELTLIKYLTRIATKTSPFGTFTNLDAIPTTVNKSRTGSDQVTSVVRLNNELYSYIKDLWSLHPQIYPHIFLRLNPTISVVETSLHFLTNNYQVESFQQMETNPALDYIRDVLQSSTGKITFGVLAKKIAREIDATEKDIHQYLLKLRDFGFLEFDFDVSGTDTEWDTKLIDKLRNLPMKHALFSDELISMLQTIRSLANQYAQAAADERQKVVEQAFTLYRNACLRIHESADLPAEERDPMPVKPVMPVIKPAQQVADEVLVQEPKPFVKKSQTVFRFKRENIFYEDSRIDSSYSLNAYKLKFFTDKLCRMLHELRLFRYEQKEMSDMYTFYIQCINDKAEVPLLFFYEMYYKEIKTTAYQEKQKTRTENDIEKKWWTNCSLHFGKSDTTHELNITIKDLQTINELTGVEAAPIMQGSYAAFIQFFKELDGSLQGILSSTMIGYGKLFSRFLHLFDPSVTQEIQKWNRTFTTEDILLLENKDSSHFNANLHPPLMPMEICTPGAQNSLAGEHLVLISDVFIKPDHTTESLKLIHRTTGKEVQVYDLGFQSVKSRSQLFQLLARFNPAQQVSPTPLVNCINALSISQAKEKGESIFVYPRLVIENDLVIQRKSWHIASHLLPLPLVGENKAEYFLRINLWIKERGIPDEVFVTINPRRIMGLSPKVARDDYKPQYIHFKNPSLVNLWVKLIQKQTPQIKIEEMLPQPKQQTCVKGKPFASETLIQWYNY